MVRNKTANNSVEEAVEIGCLHTYGDITINSIMNMWHYGTAYETVK